MINTIAQRGFDDAPEMTMRDYWQVVVRRRGLIILAVVVTVAGAMGMVSLQKKIYEGEAQMLVRSANGDNVFDSNQQSAQNAARLIETEIRVLEGNTVEDRVRQNLGIKGDLPDVSGSAVGQTDVISVKVRSHDPRVAARLANAYVTAYIDVRRDQNVNSLLDAASKVAVKVSDLTGQIAELDDQIQASNSDEEKATLTEQRQLLQDQAALFQQRLDQLQVDASVQSGAAQPVRVAEEPDAPVEPSPLRTGVLAVIVGLLLGLGAAFLADYLDDSVTTTEDLERVSGLPALTSVPDNPLPDDRPVSISKPGDVMVEAYRGLRTAVQFAAMEKPIKVIQVTSPLPGEGKTTTAANLAVLLAQTGKRVVIVDGDLRRPRLHEVFAADGQRGLTSALLGQPTLDLLWPVALPAGHLEVMAAGPIPTNPSETLGSQRMRAVIDELTRMFDLVVIDSAPVLPVTDAVVLAGLVDAVVIVARADQTTDRQLREAVGLLQRSAAPLVGAVLNGVDPDRDPYGQGYGYRKGYAAYEAQPKGKAKKAR